MVISFKVRVCSGGGIHIAMLYTDVSEVQNQKAVTAYFMSKQLPRLTLQDRSAHGKRKAMTQCWITVGTPSTMLGQAS